MRIAFYSNYLNHHQLPFCMAMDRLTDGKFTFVATTPIPEERVKFGYKDMNHSYYFVLNSYESEENQIAAMELALTADVIITGSAPEKYTVERIKKGLLTFRYSERPYKQAIPVIKIPHAAISSFLHHGRYIFKPLYILCAGAYTAGDFGKFGAYFNKCYKWGYFPEVKEENIDELFKLKHSNEKPILLWVARLIPLKHPEMAVKLAENLKLFGYDFELQIIGNGFLENELKDIIEKKNLQDCVKLLGSMSPDKVREYMEKANIFLFTSDFNEGWGAVLNESMNSACAVVASHAIGSVPFLIENNKNGLIFKNEDQHDLNNKVKMLLDNTDMAHRLGQEAYTTLSTTWNAETAATKFLQLVEHINSGKKGSPFIDGPCSVADRITNKSAGRLV